MDGPLPAKHSERNEMLFNLKSGFIKRLAKYVVVSIGFSLFNLVPANAVIYSVSSLVLTNNTSVTDDSFSLVAVDTTTNARKYNVFTRNSSVPLNKIKATITLSTGSTGAAVTNQGKLKIGRAHV